MLGGRNAGAVFVFLALLPLVAGAAAVGDRAPEFRLKDLEGKERTLAELRGEGPILIDFGSVFCAGCQEALKRLEEIRSGGGRRWLRVAAVNVDSPQSARAVRSVFRGLRAGYPVLLDRTGAVAKVYGVKQIPHLVLVDATGVIRVIRSGLQADRIEALELDAWAPGRKQP